MNIYGFTGIICFALSALVAILSPSALSQISQVKATATDKSGFRLTKMLPFSGQLVYAWDTGPLFFSGAGNEPPWQSFLTLHTVRKSSAADLSATSTANITFSAAIPKYLFIYGPQFSPDGSKLLFKIGDNIVSEWGTYRPYILNLHTNVVQEIPAPARSIGVLSMLWSPDSRYLAYLQGGFGEAFGGYSPAELHVYDTLTNSDREVVKNDGVLDSFAWTTQNQLLYSMFPTGEPPTRLPADLYQFSTSLGKSLLLRHDAYRPFPSPDGSFIAFLSVQDPRVPEESNTGKKTPLRFTYQYATNKYLTLWSRHDNKVRLIRQEGQPQFSDLRWQPDSRGVVIVNRRIENQHQDQAEVVQYFLSKDFLGSVTHLIYPDNNHLDGFNPLFVPLTVSHDGQWMFFKLIQPYEAVTNDAGQFLRAVNLSDGRILTICFYPGHGDLDWHQQ